MFLGITFQINLLHLNLCLRVCFWGNSNWVTIDIGVAFMLHLVHGFHWERLNISRRETFHWPLNPHCALQFSSATQSCPTLCDPMNCSTPGLPVHHWLRATSEDINSLHFQLTLCTSPGYISNQKEPSVKICRCSH